MKKVSIFILLGLYFLSLPLQAQEPLDLEKAIQLGLENNLQVKIGIETIALRELDRKVAAGTLFMPSLNANYLRSFATEDVTQTFVSDPKNPREIDAAKSRNKSYSIVGIYGFRPESFVTMQRLGVLTEISELDSKVIVENTVAGISTAYYRLILELQRYKVLQQTLQLSKARLEIARAQYDLGGAGKRDFLAAQVDYNGDSSLLMTQQQIIQNARVNLNELLAVDPQTTFLVQDSTISIGDRLSMEILEENAFLENKLLLVNQRRNNEAFLQLRQLQAQRLPVLNLNSNFTNSVFNSDAGFLIQNERQGINLGGSVSFNLFGGLTLNRRIQSAKVNQRIQDFNLEQYEVQLKSDLQRAYNTYENNLGLLSIEQTNYQVAKENSEIALERFRLGIASYLEFRDAQVNLLSAENRLITSIFQIKEQEIELLRLSGKIFYLETNNSAEAEID
ncbi:MAG: TolC family protein [Bacteroidota bacterium]|jgi:outer membrane protein|nr:TolC family protein [Algoriphagus sp.]